MHEDVKRFSEEGFYRDDASFMRIKDLWVRTLEDKMREYGYIPHIDIDPHWTQVYEPEKKRFAFKISMYGVYVGEKSWQKIAYSGGKIYPKV